MINAFAYIFLVIFTISCTHVTDEYEPSLENYITIKNKGKKALFTLDAQSQKEDSLICRLSYEIRAFEGTFSDYLVSAFNKEYDIASSELKTQKNKINVLVSHIDFTSLGEGEKDPGARWYIDAVFTNQENNKSYKKNFIYMTPTRLDVNIACFEVNRKFKSAVKNFILEVNKDPKFQDLLS